MLSNARLYSSDLTKRLNWMRVTVDSADLQTASPFQIVSAINTRGGKISNFRPKSPLISKNGTRYAQYAHGYYMEQSERVTDRQNTGLFYVYKDTVCILQVTVGNAAYQCSCVHYV